MFSGEKENDDWSFKPVEVIVRAKDGNWVAIKFTEEIEENTKFAYNNAYYLMAEMKKGEAEHARLIMETIEQLLDIKKYSCYSNAFIDL